MGAFTQGLTSAIGQAGEDAATGANNATLQSHQFLMDYLANQARSRGLDIQQQLANQSNTQETFQRSYETEEQNLQRQQITGAGYKELGLTYNPQSQAYENLFYNPATNDIKRIPGAPPTDSPEGQAALYNRYMNMKDPNTGQPIFQPTEAKTLVGKLSDANDPILKLQAYDEYAKSVYPNDPAKARVLSNQIREESNRASGELMFGTGGYFGGGTDTIRNTADQVANGTLLLSQVKPAEMQPAILNDLRNRGIQPPAQITADNKSRLELAATPIQNALNLVKKVSREIDAAGSSLGTASLVDLAKDPDSVVTRLLSRMALTTETPADRVKIAALSADLRTLAANMQTLQGPTGAAGYRGQAEWEKSKSDVVNAMTAPGINKEILSNLQSQLQNLLNANNAALRGEPLTDGTFPGQSTVNNNPPAASNTILTPAQWKAQQAAATNGKH